MSGAFKVYWRYRSTQQSGYPHTVYVSLSDQDRVSLQHSLNSVAEYVDVSRFRIDQVDAELVNERILDLPEARAKLAEMLGISNLP